MTSNELISTDPIIARSFFLDFPKLSGFTLISVAGLDVELDVVPFSSNGANGQQQHIKSIGGNLKTPDVTVGRMAPREATQDKLWQWFLDIRKDGLKDRTDKRQDGSIILYDSTRKEVGRFNIFGAWPTKIATDSLSTESNEPMKETITFATERIERVK